MAESFVPTNIAGLRALLNDIDAESKSAKESFDEIKRWPRFVELSRGEKIFGDKEHPVFRADIISPSVNRKIATLTETQPILDIMPRRPGLDNTARILKESCTAIWAAQSVQMAMDQIGHYMGAMGCAGMRVMFDKSAAYGLGDIVMPAIDPRTVRFDPSVIKSYEMDKAQYIGPIESIRPLSELVQLFPKKADLIKPSRISVLVGKNSKQGFWSGLKGAIQTPVGFSRGEKSGRGGQYGAVPRCYVREYWVVDPAMDENDSPMYPGGRLFIRVGQDDEDVIVNWDENPEKDQTSNPYFDGLWDFEWLDNIPDLDHPYGRSEVGALQFLQESFNREGNLIVKSGLRNGYPIWKAANNALSPETIRELKDLENFVVEYQMGREVAREQPPISPEVQMSMMSQILMLTDMILGMGDSGMKGQGRIENRSGDQLEGLQKAGQVLVRAQARRMESFLERVGKKVISRIFQFYSDDRLMTYFGGGESFKKYLFERQQLTAEIQQLGIKEAMKRAPRDKETGKRESPQMRDIVDAMLEAIKGAWRDFNFSIIPESSLSSTKIQRAMLKRELAAAMMIPSRDVLEELGYSNPNEKVQEAIEEMKMKQAMGLPPPDDGKKKSGGKKK